MITSNIKTNCDNCNKDFKFKSKMIKEKRVTDKITKLSFKCPHCRNEFLVGYKDDEINANINRIGELLKGIRTKDKWDPMELDNQLNKINNLKERNLEINARYKAIFGR